MNLLLSGIARLFTSAALIGTGLLGGCGDEPMPSPRSNNNSTQQLDCNPKLGSTKVIVLDESKKIQIKFIWLPAGKFQMGSPESEHGAAITSEEQHEVTLTRGFWIMSTEVIQDQWNAVMANNPARFKESGQLPIHDVSYDDCTAFLTSFKEKFGAHLTGWNVLLPTEAEWEYACRGGSTEKWCFGSDESLIQDYAWLDSNSDEKPHVVSQKKPSAWGLFDMHGNVAEWCKDGKRQYGKAVTDPDGGRSRFEVIVRGGHYRNPSHNTRSASRSWTDPKSGAPTIGFRIILK